MVTMKNIIITTESGSDLPQQLVEKYQVRVIPMHIVMDSTAYADGSISVDKIYEYHTNTKKIPSTSAVNVGEYMDFFHKLREEDPDCVIMHMAYSSTASSTYQNAKIAIDNFENIFLIDTQNVSGGCTAHIAKAYELIQKNKDTEDYQALADEIQNWSKKVFCSFIPGNLDYLKAGGRVTNAQYLGATLLNLKPLIEIDDNGHLIAAKKYRGSIEKLVDKYMEEFLSKHPVAKDCLYLMYSKGLSQTVLDRMKENAKRLGFKSYEYVMTGCVISCHSGPGAIGLAGCMAE